MVTSNALAHPCPHIATPEEQLRNPGYLFCDAEPGQPCLWAKRFDGYPDPSFHSERLEAPLRRSSSLDRSQREAFDQVVLATGLV